MSARLVLATRNDHKVGEVRAILAEVLEGQVSPQQLAGLVGVSDFDVPEVAETGVTFAENALLKARAACSATGLPAIADDSGLTVAVLGGSPGIFSARWCGQHGRDAENVALLLGQLADVPDEHRAAAFVAAVALVLPDGTELVEHGRVAGWITREIHGANGFGYDPIVRLDGDTRTIAELDPAHKNQISHRSQALRALAPHLAEVLGAQPS